MGEGPIHFQQLEAGGDIIIALGGSHIALGGDLPNLAEPKLNQFALEDAVDENGVDLFRALRWDYGLVQTLYGRQAELASVLKWAEMPSRAAQARLISGEGGAGKTRLAAEAARILKERGWTAGFLPAEFRSRPFGIKKNTGLFLIFDYPEERPEDRKWLFDLIVDATNALCPIRLLLLSRRSFADWEDETARLEGRFGRQAIAALGALPEANGVALITEAARRFASLTKQPMPKLEDAASWLGRHPDHRLPLFSAAAAIHAVQAPGHPFDLDGPELMRDLARRERRRVDEMSKTLGIGRTTLSELLALGALADGLGETEIHNLAAEMAKAGSLGCLPEQLFDRLRKTPWWRAGNLRCLEPDRPAAAFLTAALFPADLPAGRKELPDWLFAALKHRAENFAGRFSRVRYDLFALDGVEVGAHPLDRCFGQMFRNVPSRAVTLRAFACIDMTTWSADLGATVSVNLANIAKDQPRRASHLNNASNYLSKLGENEEALTAAQEAVDLRRSLAKAQPEAFTPNLAMSLNTIARSLSDLGRREEALAAAQEAVDLCRSLAKAQPEAFTPNLAASLNNLANRLSALGERDKALGATQKAVGLYRILAKARPEAFTPDLALSLSNLANRLSELGEREKALAAAQEAVDLYRSLAKLRPKAFMPHLARSLSILANSLLELGEHEQALAIAREAVMRLAPLFIARPMAFAPWMRPMVRSYLANCKALKQEPDMELLGPIKSQFDTLQRT
jgi:tetratricopeptide (TPR) repeat protein